MTDCGFGAAAYALGALDELELAEFRSHLDNCAVCRDELAAFEHVTHALPLAVAQISPPSRLRRHLLAKVRADVRAEARARRREGRSVRRFPAIGGLIARPAAGLACAAAFAFVGAGAVLVLGGGSRTLTHTYAAAVAAPTGSARVEVRAGHAQLVVEHLPAPKPGHVYEVWLQRNATAAPEPTRALFTIVDGSVSIPADVSRVRRVLVTQEPAGGTAVPTTSPILVADI